MISKKIILFLFFVWICGITTGCKKDKEGLDSVDIQPTIQAATQAVSMEPSPPTIESIAGSMTKEEYPVVDGSTATIPLSEAVYQLATGATKEEAASAIVHTKTSNSYYRLMSGEADLLFVYEPSEEVVKYMEDEGYKLKIKPIGKDALVFMENASNPVESLTQKQLVQIYTGRITNWAEVGGEDRELLAFQRPADSGSQTMMQKLVMGKEPMVEGTNVIYFKSMEGILEAMADYNNEGNTLGYSVYFYAQNMYQLPELKFMKVNGIEPSLETIYDNSYPYVNDFYVAIREDEPIDSNAYKIFDWLTGEEGQTLVGQLGYVPVNIPLTENADATQDLVTSKLPKNYKYITASYTNDHGLMIGTVTIYDNNWEEIRVLSNAYVAGNLGLVPDASLIPIGYAVHHDDGTYSMRYNLYSVAKDEFVLPENYDTLRTFDEERGYYSVSQSGENKVIDLQANVLISKFPDDEGGYGITKKGDYYWLNNYSQETNVEVCSIYNKNFKLVKQFDRDYFALYEEDGTVLFSKKLFCKHFGYQDKSSDTFNILSYQDGDSIFCINYNGNAMVLDKNLNVIAKKKANNWESTYEVFHDIYADMEYDTASQTTIGIFYDMNGNKIMDENGILFSDYVMSNYWNYNEWGEQGESELVLYGVDNHTLRILRYKENKSIEINLGDWNKVNVQFLYGDIAIVEKVDNSGQTRIYKGNTLLYELDGLYYNLQMNESNLLDRILLMRYGATSKDNYYLVINKNGELLYKSAYQEEILSIDENYIQINRGNYSGIINYAGEFIIKSIQNRLTDD